VGAEHLPAGDGHRAHADLSEAGDDLWDALPRPVLGPGGVVAVRASSAAGGRGFQDGVVSSWQQGSDAALPLVEKVQERGQIGRGPLGAQPEAPADLLRRRVRSPGGDDVENAVR
jgi:hypothetical protein